MCVCVRVCGCVCVCVCVCERLNDTVRVCIEVGVFYSNLPTCAVSKAKRLEDLLSVDVERGCRKTFISLSFLIMVR